MLRLCFSLGVMLYLAFFFVCVTKKKVGRILPLVYVAIATLMFCATLLGKLSYFKYFLIFFAIFTMAFIIYNLIKKKINIGEIVKLYIRPSLLVFALFFIYLYFVLGNVELSNIDDLNFWGIRVLDVLRNDEFYTLDKYAVLGNTTYPPFSTLLEAAFIKMFGSVDQSFSMLAMGTFSFSFFLALFDSYDFNFQDGFKAILTFAITVFITLSVQKNYSMAYDSYIYNSLYVDWILAIVLGFSISRLVKFDIYDTYSYFEIGMCSYVLIATKQIGMALVLLITVMTGLVILLKLNFKFDKKALLKYTALAVVLPLFVYLLWRLQINQFNEINISAGIVNGLEEVVQGNAVSNDRNLKLMSDFFSACLKQPIIMHPIQMSYYLIIIVITGVLIAIGFIRKEEKSYYIIPVFYFLGGLAYALGILLSYMYIFGPEGDTLAMFGRYMQTYTYAGYITLANILIQKAGIKKLIVCTLIAFLFVEPDSIKSVSQRPETENYRYSQVSHIKNYLEYEYNYQPMVVFNQTDMRYKALFRYLAEEKNSSIMYAQVTEDKTYEDFLGWISDKDLIYIGDFDERFLKYWNRLTDIEPYNSSLYRVSKDDNEINIELVYTWDDV